MYATGSIKRGFRAMNLGFCKWQKHFRSVVIKSYPQCSGDVVLLKCRGRTASYRGQKGLAVPDDLEILTCVGCGAEWEIEELSKKLDEVFQCQMT